jgi:hypothetical protein
MAVFPLLTREKYLAARAPTSRAAFVKFGFDKFHNYDIFLDANLSRNSPPGFHNCFKSGFLVKYIFFWLQTRSLNMYI